MCEEPLLEALGVLVNGVRDAGGPEPDINHYEIDAVEIPGKDVSLGMKWNRHPSINPAFALNVGASEAKVERCQNRSGLLGECAGIRNFNLAVGGGGYGQAG